MLVENFITYPWENWWHAVAHYKETYPDLDWSDFIERLRALKDEWLDEEDFSQICEAAKYHKVISPTRCPTGWCRCHSCEHIYKGECTLAIEAELAEELDLERPEPDEPHDPELDLIL